MKTLKRRSPFERRVLALIARYQPLMGLARWRLIVRFGHLTDTAPPVGSTAATAAGNEADSRYRRAIIQFDPSLYSGPQDPELEADVIHELLHCYSQRQRALVDYLWAWIVEETEEAHTVDLEQMPIWRKT